MENIDKFSWLSVSSRIEDNLFIYEFSDEINMNELPADILRFMRTEMRAWKGFFGYRNEYAQQYGMISKIVIPNSTPTGVIDKLFALLNAVGIKMDRHDQHRRPEVIITNGLDAKQRGQVISDNVRAEALKAIKKKEN